MTLFFFIILIDLQLNSESDISSLLLIKSLISSNADNEPLIWSDTNGVFSSIIFLIFDSVNNLLSLSQNIWDYNINNNKNIIK